MSSDPPESSPTLQPRVLRLAEGVHLGAPTAVVIGNFDGVHRGHKAVLTEARSLANARGLESTVLTFDPHPALVLAGTDPPRLTTLARRSTLLLRDVDRVCVQPFDDAFAQTTPQAFAELLKRALGAKLVVVGENFRFGHQRAGDLAQLVALGATLGFEVKAPRLAGDEEGRFSSSRARTAIVEGDLIKAASVLGRPHSVSGVVERGAELGRTIAFPTANLGGVRELAPPRGVYAVRVDRAHPSSDGLSEETSPLGSGVMNLGVRPTVGDDLEPSLEVFILDWSGDLYGEHLRVHLIEKIRDEKKFKSLDTLKAQITKDVASARKILSKA